MGLKVGNIWAILTYKRKRFENMLIFIPKYTDFNYYILFYWPIKYYFAGVKISLFA